jgi:2-oxoglutarate dehydrogenase E2 component (dihydrolipoamide succinyltransferase)
MTKYNLLLPRMGESVSEATIVKWTKKIGDSVEIDETLLEIATDKVDTDVPSPVAGKIIEQLFQEDEVAQVGDVIAILQIENGEEEGSSEEASSTIHEDQHSLSNDQSISESSDKVNNTLIVEEHNNEENSIPGLEMFSKDQPQPTSERFLSPLVKSIALEEGISLSELQNVKGSGLEGRLTKVDIIKYIQDQKEGKREIQKTGSENVQASSNHSVPIPSQNAVFTEAGDEVIEMDRMRRLISDHMINSINTAAHVTSFAEADVTNIVNWRNKNKDIFLKREGTKITFTPIFIEAIAKAIRDFPMINVSVNGNKIIKRKNINIGMAAALPNGNLIVPVIKGADQLNLVGISKSVNDLAHRARTNKLKPDEVQDGTFTLTNIGSFGNIMGTPIINQPQVAILAVGSITKKPAVIETEYGDMIGIRHKMYLSLSYDHRVVDGALGGMFLHRIKEYLEAWDVNRIV